MRIRFQVSEGVPAAQWIATKCGHREMTMDPVGSEKRCAMCDQPGCTAVAHKFGVHSALNHLVTLTCHGEMLHTGEAIIEGIITVSSMETRCSPELLEQIRELGDFATGEITANLTAGRGADGDALDIEDETDDDDYAQPAQASLRDLFPSDCPDRD